MTDPDPRLTRGEICHLLIILAIACFGAAALLAKVIIEEIAIGRLQ